MVTDDELCNLVDEENKECQICGVLVSTTQSTENANKIFGGINTAGGLLQICTAENPITAYGAVIGGLSFNDNPVTDGIIKAQIVTSFATCLNAVNSQAIGGNELSINNSPVQASSSQSSQEASSVQVNGTDSSQEASSIQVNGTNSSQEASSIQVNGTDSSQEPKISSQNVEVNKAIEQQPKETTVLPLFNFSPQ